MFIAGDIDERQRDGGVGGNAIKRLGHDYIAIIRRYWRGHASA